MSSPLKSNLVLIPSLLNVIEPLLSRTFETLKSKEPVDFFIVPVTDTLDEFSTTGSGVGSTTGAGVGSTTGAGAPLAITFTTPSGLCAEFW